MESAEDFQHHQSSPDTGKQNDTPGPSGDEAGPSLGYNGTGGYNSQSDTSREAAYHDLVEGVTAKAQRLTLILAAQAGERGLTIVDLREAKGSLHHGKMSSALTNLHKGGRLVRLQERRDRSHVYVLPEFASERETSPFKPNRPQIDRTELVNLLEAHSLRTTGDGNWGCRGNDWTGLHFHDHRGHLADVIIAEFGKGA